MDSQPESGALTSAIRTRLRAVLPAARKSLPLLVVLAAACVFFLPVLVEGTTFYAFDALGEYWPWHATGAFPQTNNPLLTDPITGLYPPTFYMAHLHFQTALKHGGLAFWDGSILGGLPYQHYLSPFHYLVFSLLPLTVAHDVLLFCGLSLVGVFTYLLFRRYGLRASAAVFGALAFMFNGYLMVWLEFEHILALAAGLAGSLYFSERLFADRRWTSALAIALCLSASIGIAHPQQSIYLGGFVACYCAYRLWTCSREEPGFDLCAVARLLGLALLTTMVLASGYLIQSADQIAGSGRASLSFGELMRRTGSLPLSYLVTLLAPDFFGSPTLGWAYTPKPLGPQPYNNYAELCIYVGVPTLALALVGLRLLRRPGLPRFFAGTALATLLLAGGTLLYFPIAAVIPGMGLTTPCRLLFLFGFAIACLAAFALDHLLQPSPGSRLPALAVPFAMLLLAGAIVLVLVLPGGPAWLWRAMGSEALAHPERIATHFAMTGSAFARPLVLVACSAVLLGGVVLMRDARWRTACAAALTVVLFFDLAEAAWTYDTRSPRTHAFPSTAAIRFLQQDPSKFRIMTLAPFFLENSFAPFGIEDAGGYRSFYPRRYGEFIQLSQEGRGAPPDQFSRWCNFRAIGSPLLDLLNVKYVLMPAIAEVPERHFRLVYRGEAQVYENLHVFPRAFLVTRAVAIPDEKLRLERLRSSSRRDLQSTVILDKEVPRPLASEPAGEDLRPVEIVRYAADELELQVPGGPGGFVVVSDNYHPNWRAWVDGRPAEILRANHIMRAVAVAPGAHLVTMQFVAHKEIAGLLVSNLGWLAVVVVVISIARRRQRQG